MSCAAALLLLALGRPAFGDQSYAPVDVSGRSSTSPSARLSWQIRKQERPPLAEGVLPKRSTLGGGLELKYSRFRGKQGQGLTAGEVIALDGGSVTDPQDLMHRFDLSYLELVMTSTIAASESPSRFELTFSLGLGYLDSRLHTDPSGNDALQVDDQTIGFSFGFGARKWLHGVIALEGHLSAFTPNPFMAFFGGAFGDGLNDEAWGGEVALVVAPLDHLWLRGGYAGIGYAADHDAGSAVTIKTSGPFLGFQVAF